MTPFEAQLQATDAGRAISAFDWSTTPLGPASGWPTSLTALVAMMLACPTPMYLAWGPDLNSFYNDAYAPILGVRRAGAMGAPFRVLWGDIWDDIGPLVDAALAGEDRRMVDMQLDLHRQGVPEESWWTFTYSPVRDEAGAIAGMLCVTGETTERVIAERQRDAADERLQLALSAGNSIGVWDWDVARDRVTADERFAALYGIDPDVAAAGTSIREFFRRIHPDDLAEVERAIAEAIATGSAFASEYRLLAEDGTVRWAAAQGRCILDEAGRAVRFPGVSFDVTDRERARADLAESEARYRTLFETIDEGFCVVEFIDGPHGIASDYLHLEANPAYHRHAGITEIVGHTGREKLTPGEAEDWVRLLRRALETREPIRFERELEATGRYLEVACIPLVPFEKRQVAIVFQDVSARKRAELELRQLNETLENQVADRTAELRRFRDIVDATVAPICAFDTDFRLIAFNRAHNAEFRRVNGFETRIGDVFPDLFVPEQRPVMRELMSRALSGESFMTVAAFGRPELGTPYWEIVYTPLRDEAGAVIGAFHHATDISERLVAEAELAIAQDALRQSQKMEAMGQLTGGVAHDFNNLLSPIIGSLDLLQRKGVGSERERRLIDGALQSAERAKTLVQRLLAFARRQPLQPIPVDTARLVGGMVELIGSTLGPAIDLRIDLPRDLPPANADANQLEMALLNLAVNARDAMPQGGDLTIAAARESVRGEHPAGVARGHYIRLSVRDTGSGMDEETRRRAVEPFFSTKGTGKGTGLGLSMVHGLVAQLGGGLTIDSAPGRGTAIDIWLPLSAIAIEEEDAPVAAPEPPRARGRALLVDDEELVRISTADMLADLGFEVTEAGSAEEALRLIEAGPAPDLLVTDHLMPGMTGDQLARRVKADRPGIAVLIVSGYAEEDGIDPGIARLTKPFRNAELADSVAALMATG